MTGQIDKLFLGSPIEFAQAWVDFSNGGLWRLCQESLKGEKDAIDSLQRLKELIESQRQDFVNHLQWFLREQNLPIELAKQLLKRINRIVNDFLTRDGGDWAIFENEEVEEDEIPRIELQGLGVQQDLGFAVRLTLELRDSPNKTYQLLPHPSCCLIPQDSDFVHSLDNVRRWWVEKSNLASSPLQITWRIARSDGRPLNALKGSSLGGLFAIGIWLLWNPELLDQTISVSAAISPDGLLEPVSGLPQKLQAAFQCIPPLRVLIVANGQNLTNVPKVASISIKTAASVDEVISLFVEQNKDFVEARKRTCWLYRNFTILNDALDWSCYQEPTLTFVSENKSLPLSHWLKRWLQGETKHWLLVAPSGMGKTTALKFIAHRVVEEDANFKHLLPVYLRADDWQKVTFNKGRMSLPDVLEELHRFPSAPSREQWQKWAELGRLILLVDQMERVASNLDFLEHIRETISDYQDLFFLMATRSEQLSSFTSLDLPIVHLEPFSEVQAKELIQKLSQHFNRPFTLPTGIPLDKIAPFLLIALVLIKPPLPQGQGKLYLELLKFMLEGANLNLPRERVIEILSEVALSPTDKNEWSEQEFYEKLRSLTAPQIADQIWAAIEGRLITRTNGSYCFNHTLLLETLRAYALALSLRNNKISFTEFVRFLTPLRAVLITSLLDPKDLPEFWKWIQRRMESEPKEWAETVAQCLNERPDYPQQIVNLILARWFEAFHEGTNEAEGWDRAVEALPADAIEKFVFSSVQQKLTDRRLSERRSAAYILSLVAHKVTLTPSITELLAKAFMDEYGFALVNEIKKIFLSPIQQTSLRDFISTTTKFLEGPSMSQQLRAIDATQQLVDILTEDLRAEVANRLKEIARSDKSPKVCSAAYKVLHRLQSTE